MSVNKKTVNRLAQVSPGSGNDVLPAESERRSATLTRPSLEPSSSSYDVLQPFADEEVNYEGYSRILIQGFKDDMYSRKFNGVYDVEQEEDEAGKKRFSYIKKILEDRVIEYNPAKKEWQIKATVMKGSADKTCVVGYFGLVDHVPIHLASKGSKWFINPTGSAKGDITYREERLVKVTANLNDISIYQTEFNKKLKDMEELAAKNREGAKVLLITGCTGTFADSVNGVYRMTLDSFNDAPIYDKTDKYFCLQFQSVGAWYISSIADKGLWTTEEDAYATVTCMRPIAPELITSPVALVGLKEPVLQDTLRFCKEGDPLFVEYQKQQKLEDDLVSRNRRGAQRLCIDGFTEASSTITHGLYIITDENEEGAPVYEKMGNSYFRVKYGGALEGWGIYIGSKKIAQMPCHKPFSPDSAPRQNWQQMSVSKEKWIDAPRVKTFVSTDSQYASLETKFKEEVDRATKSRETAANVVLLFGHEGETGDLIHGMYVKTDELANLVFVYVKRDGRRVFYLQYNGSDWTVTAEKNSKTSLAKLSCSLAVPPELVHPTAWKAASGTGWSDSNLAVFKEGDKAFDAYAKQEALDAQWVLKNKEGAKSVLLVGAKGLESKRINGLYDLVLNEDSCGGPVYVKRGSNDSIWFWQDPNDKEDMKFMIGAFESRGKPIRWAELKCKKPLPLEMVRSSVWKVFDQSWSDQPDIKATVAQDAIDKWFRQVEEEKELNKLHTDFIVKDTPSFDDDASVDEMKIQTMFRMVEDVTVQWEGRDIPKKVLYLTNKQANMFDDQSMLRCIEALEVSEPKFVIILLAAMGDSVQMQFAHAEDVLTPTPVTTYLGGDTQRSEVDASDEDTVRTSVIMFMKNCILPLAKQTKALIIVQGANDCFLSAALANVVLEEQARLGKDCPFSVVALCWEFEVHYKGVLNKESGSLAGQIARGCSAWRKRVPILEKMHFEKHDRDKLQRCDLTPAASRYIIFESMDKEGSIQRSFLRTFKSTLIQCLTKTLPSIAIQSHGCDSLGYLNDILARNIPVLLLDTTERSFSARRLENGQGLSTRLARESNSFPSILQKQADALQNIGDERSSVDLISRHVLLDIAEQMVERKWSTLMRYGSWDSLNCTQLAFFHSAISIGSKAKTSAKNSSLALWERIAELEKFEQENKESKRFIVNPELAARVVNFLQKREGALKLEANKFKAQMWVKDNPTHDLVPSALGYISECEIKILDVQSNGGLLSPNPYPNSLGGDSNAAQAMQPEGHSGSSTFLLPMELLSNPLTFSGSIHAVDDLERILRSVAKIDRLPTGNTLEALRTMQDAWDCIEIYDHVASSYKFVAKVTYISLILIGIAITILSQVELHTGWFSSRVPILSLSLAGTVIVGYISYMNPAVRWQQLRVASLNLETNIWQFRTRAGPYRTEHGSDEAALHLLSQTVRLIKASVLEGADIKSTAFYSRAEYSNKHKQHKNKNNKHDEATFRGSNSFSLVSRIKSFISSGNKIWENLFKRPTQVLPIKSHLKPVSGTLNTITADFEKDDVSEHGCGSDFGSDIGSAVGSAFAAESVLSSSTYSSPDKRVKETESKKRISAHIHVLKKMSRSYMVYNNQEFFDLSVGRGDSKGECTAAGWKCDGRHLPGGCSSEAEGMPAHTYGWVCEECQFDLCLSCVRKAMNKPFPNQIDCRYHHHTLVKSTGYRGKRYVCAMRFTGEKCKSGTTGERMGGFSWRCAECNFNVCPYCIDFIRAQPYTAPSVPLETALARLRQDDDESPDKRDDHYAPLQPDSYVKFRMNTALTFYKDKIPRCTRTRNFAQSLLILGSVGTAALDFANQSAWAAVISIVTSGITAFLEYQGTNSKISRYSSTVHALQELVLWWQTLPAIEKSSIANIDHLIMASEELLQREQQAWKSTSQAIKVLRKETSGGKEENV